MDTKQINGRSHTQCRCDHCDQPFWKRTSFLSASNFCSAACKAAGQRRGSTTECAQCGDSIYVIDSRRKKSERLFCGHKCRAEYYNHQINGELHPNWTGGKHSYRARALKHYGAHCHAPGCPVTAAGIEIPESMLDVDHIDNNRRHNQIENLQVICVWCHALKTRT